MNMEETPPLPELHQGELDVATIRQLFADLAAHAEMMEIIPKHGRGHVEECPPRLTLDEAAAMWESGALRGLQLRYRYREQIWWDTLMPLADGRSRLIRIEHRF